MSCDVEQNQTILIQALIATVWWTEINILNYRENNRHRTVRVHNNNTHKHTNQTETEHNYLQRRLFYSICIKSVLEYSGYVVRIAFVNEMLQRVTVMYVSNM